MIDPTFCGSRFSTGRLLVIEDFTCIQETCSHEYWCSDSAASRDITVPSHETSLCRVTRHHCAESRDITVPSHETSLCRVTRHHCAESRDITVKIKRCTGNGSQAGHMHVYTALIRAHIASRWMCESIVRFGHSLYTSLMWVIRLITQTPECL